MQQQVRNPVRAGAARRGDLLVAAGLLLPAALIFLVFTGLPFVWAAWLSLVEWDGFSTSQQFVGLENYTTLLDDPLFWNSLLVTVAYTVGVTVFSIGVGLLIAMAVNARIAGRTIYRTIFFTPVITATVAAAVVWSLLFDPNNGMVNLQLRGIGMDGEISIAGRIDDITRPFTLRGKFRGGKATLYFFPDPILFDPKDGQISSCGGYNYQGGGKGAVVRGDGDYCINGKVGRPLTLHYEGQGRANPGTSKRTNVTLLLTPVK